MIDTTLQIFNPFLTIIAAGAGISVVAMGRLVSLRSMMGLTAPVLGALADRIGYRRVIRGSLLAVAAGMLVIGFSTGLAPLEMVPRRAAASAVGLTGAMSYLGAVITSTMSGWITDRWSWKWTFLFWVACAALAAMILLPLCGKAEHQRG